MGLEDDLGQLFRQRPDGGAFESLAYTQGVARLVRRADCAWILDEIAGYYELAARHAARDMWYFAIERGTAQLLLVEGGHCRFAPSVRLDEARSLWYEAGVLTMDYEHPDWNLP